MDVNDLRPATVDIANPAVEKQAASCLERATYSLNHRKTLAESGRMKMKQSFDEILESAVVANWVDLMRGAQSGLIHIEYGFAPSGTLDNLQVWSSISRGHWLLACAHRRSDSEIHDTGVHFENGYESEPLAHVLECVITHQNAFSAARKLGREGLLQIATPTQEETSRATASVKDAFDDVASAFADAVRA
jgi:hypothetical protein